MKKNSRSFVAVYRSLTAPPEKGFPLIACLPVGRNNPTRGV
jgi:hypothetical protein